MTPETSAPFALATYLHANSLEPHGGLVVGRQIIPLMAAADFLQRQGLSLAAHSVFAILKTWEASFPLLERVAEAFREASAELSSVSVPTDAVTWCAPLDPPRQIYCSGANYRKHVIELIVAQETEQNRLWSRSEREAFGIRQMDERAASGTPFFFCKPGSCSTGAFADVLLPEEVSQLDWELELGVVIGKRARRVSRDAALNYVAGYTIVNDVTARDKLYRRAGDLRELGLDWIAGKGAPSFLPTGPFLVPAQYVEDPQALQISLKLNGETKQDESTADMIFEVRSLIESLSHHVVLEPGDLICTGSPAGNGMHFGQFLQPGDVMEATISRLGTQCNTCRREDLSRK
jgi:2-keto-4-pentenoate hydratase/2-oxohepta-3-ene-1,7-dioic acid hydratase in catechol pathway